MEYVIGGAVGLAVGVAVMWLLIMMADDGANDTQPKHGQRIGPILKDSKFILVSKSQLTEKQVESIRSSIKYLKDTDAKFIVIEAPLDVVRVQ